MKCRQQKQQINKKKKPQKFKHKDSFSLNFIEVKMLLLCSLWQSQLTWNFIRKQRSFLHSLFSSLLYLLPYWDSLFFSHNFTSSSTTTSTSTWKKTVAKASLNGCLHLLTKRILNWNISSLIMEIYMFVCKNLKVINSFATWVMPRYCKSFPCLSC